MIFNNGSRKFLVWILINSIAFFSTINTPIIFSKSITQQDVSKVYLPITQTYFGPVFSTPSVIYKSNNYISRPEVVNENNGIYHVVFEEYLGSNNFHRVIYLRFWEHTEIARVIFENRAKVVQNPRLAVDDGGNAHVYFTSCFKTAQNEVNLDTCIIQKSIVPKIYAGQALPTPELIKFIGDFIYENLYVNKEYAYYVVPARLQEANTLTIQKISPQIGQKTSISYSEDKNQGMRLQAKVDFNGVLHFLIHLDSSDQPVYGQYKDDKLIKKTALKGFININFAFLMNHELTHVFTTNPPNQTLWYSFDQSANLIKQKTITHPADSGVSSINGPELHGVVENASGGVDMYFESNVANICLKDGAQYQTISSRTDESEDLLTYYVDSYTLVSKENKNLSLSIFENVSREGCFKGGCQVIRLSNVSMSLNCEKPSNSFGFNIDKNFFNSQYSSNGHAIVGIFNMYDNREATLYSIYTLP